MNNFCLSSPVSLGLSEKYLQTYFEMRCNIFKTKVVHLCQNTQNLIPMIYYKEIGKINMNFGRQTGHSYFMHWLLNHCTETNQKCLCLFYSDRIMKTFISDHIPINTKTRCNIDKHIMITFNNSSKREQESKFDYIVVDTSDLYTTSQRDKIINRFQHVKPLMFIYI